MANEKPVNFIASRWWESTAFGGFSDNTTFEAGRSTLDGDSISKGALRFTSIDIGNNESINMAELRIKATGGNGAGGNLKLTVKGVKEINPNTDYPFGRTLTSATITVDQAFPGNGNYLGIGLTNIVQEIVNQGGWTRFDALQFIIDNNGSGLGSFIDANNGDTYLVYRINAEPDFTPTNKTKTAGALPASTDVGVKISKPGVSVLTAVDEDLYFTTRKNMRKLHMEGSTSCTAGVEKLIAHNLGYVPQALAFAQGGGKSFKLPRFFASATDPIGGGLEGDIRVDSTYLRITVLQNSDVYYYIFLDEQPS